MKQLRIWIVGALFVCAVFVLAVMAIARLPQPQKANGKLQITATFYPMAEFARQVGGTDVTVTTLVKPGVEPHDYDPTPRDVAGIYKSRLFIYNGAGLERWVGKIQNDLARNHVVSIEVSKGLPLRPADPGDPALDSAPTDPHVWMDPALAAQEVANIRDGLSQADPAHAKNYQTNANSYIMRLQQLDADFKLGLASCRLDAIITSHQAFSYLGAHYGIRPISIAGLSPDDEPSPQKLAEVAQLAKQNKAHYIFFEDLVSPKLSQTIAQEVGATTLAFNPLEGLTDQQIKDGKNYLSVQRDNLQALRTALECK